MKVLPLIASLSLAGCSAGITVDYARLAPDMPRPVRDAASVAVFFREPSCNFQELGVLEVNPGAWGSSIQQQIDTLRAEAGKRGANGILMIAHNDTSSGDHHRSGMTRHSYTALAIQISSCETPVAQRPSPQPSSPSAAPSSP